MLFLGDRGHYYGRFPWVTVALVVANVFVFSAQIVIGDRLNYGYSMVPEEITTFHDLKGPKGRKVWLTTHDGRYVERNVTIHHYPGPFPIWLTLLTSMFMHGSFGHIFFNMWALLIFGRNVECAMGHMRFLLFYLACGVLAGLAHVASDPHSIVPCVGASGAIAGVMGAYISIYPLNMIKVWFIVVFEIPALAALGAWILLEYIAAAMSDNQISGTAHWAHVGGFVAGFVILRIMVFNLRRAVAADEAAKKQLSAAEEHAAGANPEELPYAEPVEQAPDPYAGFITMQTVRRMQENKNPGRPTV